MIPGAIHAPADAALALAALAALLALRWPPLAVVLLLAGTSWWLRA
jgi:hypothetical protein